MTDKRFNELVNGPLWHPLPGLALTRLTLALRTVVEACGADGERALEAYCRAREERDGGESEAIAHG